jgi:hypothetical protein
VVTANIGAKISGAPGVNSFARVAGGALYTLG